MSKCKKTLQLVTPIVQLNQLRQIKINGTAVEVEQRREKRVKRMISHFHILFTQILGVSGKILRMHFGRLLSIRKLP